MLVFDRPHGLGAIPSMKPFRDWLIDCMDYARTLCKEDPQLADFINDRKTEIALLLKDYNILIKTAEQNKLDIKAPFQHSMIRTFADASGLSAKSRTNISNKYFSNYIKLKEQEQKSFSVEYVINRATSLDWSIIDLFYQLNGFRYFRAMYDLAQKGLDEGPICNLGLITQYLSRFMDEYSTVITASWLNEEKFVHSFFSGFTYALFRLGESEYEDADDPFPKGRISFLTIHQSKGLEFPVVVLGSVEKKEWEADIKEQIVRDLLQKDGEPGGSLEPLDKISKFDNMRMFYVALSRAKKLLVLPRIATTRTNAPRPDQIKGTDEFKAFFASQKFTAIPEFDMDTLSKSAFEETDLGKSYSYTGDYLNYIRCPRQYMIMRKYGFVSGRTQTMMFGSLVHQTIEDLHYLLIEERKKERP
jgi:DNA helicase-2/ATP-dependent DNA helicase PcrA